MSLKACECGIVYDAGGWNNKSCPLCKRDDVLHTQMENLSAAALETDPPKKMINAIIRFGERVGDTLNCDIYLDEECPNYVALLKKVGEYPEFEEYK